MCIKSYLENTSDWQSKTRSVGYDQVFTELHPERNKRSCHDEREWMRDCDPVPCFKVNDKRFTCKKIRVLIYILMLCYSGYYRQRKKENGLNVDFVAAPGFNIRHSFRTHKLLFQVIRDRIRYLVPCNYVQLIYLLCCVVNNDWNTYINSANCSISSETCTDLYFV